MSEIIQLEKTVCRFLEIIAEKSQSLSVLHERLKERDIRIEELQTKIADEVAASKRLRGEINTTKQSEAIWRHHAVVRGSTMTKLNGEITDLHHNLSVSMITIRGLQASLSRKEKGFKDNIKKLNDSCDEKVKFLEENRDSLYTKTRYLDSYKEEIESLRMNYASHSGRIRYLEKANSKLVTENRQFLDKIDRLKQDSAVNNCFSKRVESLANQLAWARKTEGLLINRIRSLKEELDLSDKEMKIQEKEMSDEIRDLNEEKDGLRKEWKASEEIRSVLEAELAEYMKQVGNLDLMKRFDPNFCNRIDSWMETKKENGEIPEAAKNERS